MAPVSGADGDYQFAKNESPAMPGGPFTPSHPASRKAGYPATALALALFATFGNSLVSNNSSQVSGQLGLYSAEGTWLTVAYTGMSASASLFLIKGRQQFGIARIIKYLLAFYALASALELILPGFATAIIGRCANGLVTATGVALGVYYMLEVLPAAKRPAAIPIILGCVQMGGPLARLVPVELLTDHSNFGLHLINIAIPVIELAMILTWPLPPTPTYRVFEWQDVFTVLLLLPGLVLLVGVLALGRVHWWIDTPWLGWMLVFAIPLLALGVLYELSRARPALWIGWMSRGDMARFAAVAFFERIALAEQSYGAVGLLSDAGLNDDQLHGLFVVVLIAMLAGLVIVVATLSVKAIPFQIIGAMLLIAIAAWTDSFSNGNTRIHELLPTQAMVGLGTTLFVGPALLYGVLHVMKAGPQFLLSMIMIFSFTQNVGSLVGSALLSSYQYVHSQDHERVLADSISLANPLVAARVKSASHAAMALTPDAGASDAAGAASVGGPADEQANVLGFVDVFRLVAVIAGGGAIAVTAMVIRKNLFSGQKAPAS